MKILGYEIKKGTFTDKVSQKQIDYHNVLLYIPKEGENIKGVCTDTIKIKYSVFIDLLNAAKIGIDNIVGMEINIYFDRYGNPTDITKV